jgi:hypothetical protein
MLTKVNFELRRPKEADPEGGRASAEALTRPLAAIVQAPGARFWQQGGCAALAAVEITFAVGAMLGAGGNGGLVAERGFLMCVTAELPWV